MRPVTTSGTRRRFSTGGMTPLQSAKKDLNLLLSATDTTNFIDFKLQYLSDKSPKAPSQNSNEISQQLNILKHHNNTTQFSRSKMNSRLRKLSLELFEVSEAKKKADNKLAKIYNKISNLKDRILEIQDFQEDQLNDQDVYLHLQERLHTTMIFLDMKKHYLNTQLKNKNFVLSEVSRLRLRSSEQRVRSTRVYRKLNSTMTYFNRKGSEMHKKLDKDRSFYDNIDNSRDTRYRRYLDISEKVGIAERNRIEKKTRTGFLLHKFWYKFLSKRSENYMQKFSLIDEAFRKIKGVTGLDDIESLVQKFLTKEQTLQELMTVIQKNKQTVEKFSNRNMKIQEKIKEFAITDRNSLTGSLIQDLNSQILVSNMKKSNDSKKYMQTKSVHIMMNKWIAKMIKLFNPDFTQESESSISLISILREEVRKKIRPVTKQDLAYDMHSFSVFLTENPSFLRKSNKKIIEETIEPHELNHVESETNESKGFFSKLDRKLTKSRQVV